MDYKLERAKDDFVVYMEEVEEKMSCLHWFGKEMLSGQFCYSNVGVKEDDLYQFVRTHEEQLNRVRSRWGFIKKKVCCFICLQRIEFSSCGVTKQCGIDECVGENQY